MATRLGRRRREHKTPEAQDGGSADGAAGGNLDVLMAGLGIIAGIPKEHDYDKYPADDRNEAEQDPIAGLAGIVKAAHLSGYQRNGQGDLGDGIQSLCKPAPIVPAAEKQAEKGIEQGIGDHHTKETKPEALAGQISFEVEIIAVAEEQVTKIIVQKGFEAFVVRFVDDFHCQLN